MGPRKSASGPTTANQPRLPPFGIGSQRVMCSAARKPRSTLSERAKSQMKETQSRLLMAEALASARRAEASSATLSADTPPIPSRATASTSGQLFSPVARPSRPDIHTTKTLPQAIPSFFPAMESEEHVFRSHERLQAALTLVQLSFGSHERLQAAVALVQLSFQSHEHLQAAHTLVQLSDRAHERQAALALGRLSGRGMSYGGQVVGCVASVESHRIVSQRIASELGRMHTGWVAYIQARGAITETSGGVLALCGNGGLLSGSKVGSSESYGTGMPRFAKAREGLHLIVLAYVSMASYAVRKFTVHCMTVPGFHRKTRPDDRDWLAACVISCFIRYWEVRGSIGLGKRSEDVLAPTHEPHDCTRGIAASSRARPPDTSRCVSRASRRPQDPRRRRRRHACLAPLQTPQRHRHRHRHTHTYHVIANPTTRAGSTRPADEVEYDKHWLDTARRRGWKTTASTAHEAAYGQHTSGATEQTPHCDSPSSRTSERPSLLSRRLQHQRNKRVALHPLAYAQVATATSMASLLHQAGPTVPKQSQSVRSARLGAPIPPMMRSAPALLHLSTGDFPKIVVDF
ncbi:hypothetical protein P171DRAFT_506019 [Karstenula rhodostoma CBS 690.94]|uniref:Uncharacterized protein n=1 Tax=Karstenula rhodostoma CBS 690.94 TaxID=1392251 RepID=A0A9P4P733_9PLEO|nr:hypothetical protein P171DRAFT_506019 [Karstenula rhodostoma CBS 690.94]